MIVSYSFSQFNLHTKPLMLIELSLLATSDNDCKRYQKPLFSNLIYIKNLHTERSNERSKSIHISNIEALTNILLINKNLPLLGNRIIELMNYILGTFCIFVRITIECEHFGYFGNYSKENYCMKRFHMSKYLFSLK